MPPPTMTYERFDVLTALFPFIDIPIRKPRPVMVLSNAAFYRTNGHIVTVMITTGTGSHWPSGHSIIDLTAAGLRHSSVVLCKLFTLPNSEIGHRIGHLAAPDRDCLAAHFSAILHA